MFTGIVEEIGEIKKIAGGSSSISVAVLCERIIDDIKTGDSIAVNGICFTVTSVYNSTFVFDVMPQTMRNTNIGKLKISDKVNLERALRFSDRLGGHIVSGHIDGTGVLSNKTKDDNAIILTIETSKSILKYIVLKGSVALDGVSLTVSHIDEMSFKVSLIPLTQDITILGNRSIGDTVNIECDIIGKYVEKLTAQKEDSSITIDFLKENGFA